MKNILILAVAILSAAVSRAELKTSIMTPFQLLTVDVPSGTVLQIVLAQRDLHYGDSEPGDIKISSLPGSNNPSFPSVTFAKFTSSTPFKDAVLAGPLRLEIRSEAGNAIFTYRVTNSESGLSAAGPSNTVVIPEDVTGNVSIILESSTDLVNWTAALPGTYGASTAKRFFRLRATQN